MNHIDDKLLMNYTRRIAIYDINSTFDADYTDAQAIRISESSHIFLDQSHSYISSSLRYLCGISISDDHNLPIKLFVCLRFEFLLITLMSWGDMREPDLLTIRF